MIQESEKWKTIEGYNGRYEVSNKGRVRSWAVNGSHNRRAKKPRMLKACDNSKGLMCVSLSINGYARTTLVRNLVREYWGEV